MEPVIQYRDASHADAERISRFVLSVCARDLRPAMGKEGWANMQRVYGTPALEIQLQAGCRYRLALDTDRLVGAAGLNSPVHLFLLYVHHSRRSSGIARHLVSDLLAHMPRTAPWTVNSSLGAVGFYRRLGYAEVGPPQARDGIEFQPMVHAGEAG